MKSDHKQYWQKRNVLITGVTGFVGSNLAKKLVELGANVIGLAHAFHQDSLIFHEELEQKIKIITGDVCDLALLKNTLTEENIQNIFLLAAQVEVGVARQYPFATWETNIRGTYTAMEAIRELGSACNIESIILASSDKAYGQYPEESMPYREDYPLKPVFPYDVSKACGDMIAQCYAGDLYKLPICITRFANIYGPGQLNFSALIPDCIRSALQYSTFIPRSNGEFERDFLYVEDVCDLYLRISYQLSSKPELRGEIFNCGTNETKKVADIIRLIFKQLNNEDDLKLIEEQFKTASPSGEIEIQMMNYDKVEKFFNWKPETSFDEGMARTISWYKDYLKS